MEQIRLNKYLAECGVCSRREADRLIDQGRVKVNGVVARMGQTVSPEDEILCDRKRIQGREKTVVLAYNKPVGVVCSEKDKHADKLITDMIRYPVRVTYAGRLDKDSEGLLLLTNDGDLIQAMMKGANKHEKEYVVKVDKEINREFLNRMATGIYLKELDTTTRPCEVVQIGKYTFRIVLTQGLNRQIRRMASACGYGVKSLKRIRVMNILLGDLGSGKYRVLDRAQLDELYGLCGLKGKV